jgi:glutamine amidotransferase/cyclase
MPTVHLLDYVAGNVRSLVNAIEKVGYTVAWVKTPADVPSAEVHTTPRLRLYAHQLTVADAASPVETHHPRRRPLRTLSLAAGEGGLHRADP